MITTMQISDFGLAVSLDEHGKNNIKLSGTLGYVAPEYLLDGNYVRSFSFYECKIVFTKKLCYNKCFINVSSHILGCVAHNNHHVK